MRWNGRDLPDELRELPAGEYVVEPVEGPELTEEQEEGLRAAMASLRAGGGVDGAEARRRLDALLAT